MNLWFVVMIILLGVGALTLRRYDVWRILTWIVFDWLAPGVCCSGASTCEAQS